MYRSERQREGDQGLLYRIIVIGFLIWMAVCDLKSHTVPLWPVLLFAALMAVLHLILGDICIWEVMAGALPGLFLLLLTQLLPEAVVRGAASRP